MSTESLIQELLRMRAPDADIDPGPKGLYNTGIDRAIAIIRQHEAKPLMPGLCMACGKQTTNIHTHECNGVRLVPTISIADSDMRDRFGMGPRQQRSEKSLPAWSEQGYAAACADMANQIEASRNGGGSELLAANVCISSLCIAYKNAAMGASGFFAPAGKTAASATRKDAVTEASANDGAVARDIGEAREEAKEQGVQVSPAPATADALLQQAWELSTWAASINWRGGENQKEWLDDLRTLIEAFQTNYEAYKANVSKPMRAA